MSDRDKEAAETATASTAGAVKDSDTQRGGPDAMKRAVQAEQSGPDPDEAEARALLDSFDGRITEIEQRIDRVLARLDAG